MRYSKEHKEQTRKRILEAAGRVFKRQGYQGGGIDAVMKEAGLTHGGFYAHFKNKEELFREAIVQASRQVRELRNQKGQGLEGPARVDAMLRFYLSPQHMDHVEEGCVLPPLVSELERTSDEPRKAFGQELENWRDEIVPHLGHLPEDQRPRAALGIIAACVGSMALARALEDSELKDDLLTSGQEVARRAFLQDLPEIAESSENSIDEDPSKNSRPRLDQETDR